MRKYIGCTGIFSTLLFFAALLFFSYLNPDFNLFKDYVSKLGAKGQPFALWWNIIGFAAVGAGLSIFGWGYGKIISDQLTGFLLAAYGIGFAATAIPIDMQDSTLPISKAHVAAICLALASWLLGLARINSLSGVSPKTTKMAVIAALTLVASMGSYVLGFTSMPVTHRMVFAVVFLWTAFSSIQILVDAKP